MSFAYFNAFCYCVLVKNDDTMNDLGRLIIDFEIAIFFMHHICTYMCIFYVNENRKQENICSTCERLINVCFTKLS